ncbi:hypothetical protein IQ266_01535 [filamentous cyanobacterium LEGE 11480]|uniref:Uncharacterized protein n=1 Tax=Romeriopsis navalis LEGE 11480 TaxID=2777977 RepID=A0A928VKT4_9CYAN|nr:hypothetical protein [Romeriopsis navalis]MBE9028436.1 hypothetical protein [Romeriopsis navalis LEGE 11480]
MTVSQDFFATLASMYQSEQSGAIFGITDNDRMLVVAFDAGTIKGMRFGRLTGIDVLAELQHVEFKSFAVKLDKSLPLQPGLPATVEIFTQLVSRMPTEVLAEVLVSSATQEQGTSANSKIADGQAVPAEDTPAQPQPQRKMMYRGQVVEAPPQAPARRSRMMYRGQPIGE